MMYWREWGRVVERGEEEVGKGKDEEEVGEGEGWREEDGEAEGEEMKGRRTWTGRRRWRQAWFQVVKYVCSFPFPHSTSFFPSPSSSNSPHPITLFLPFPHFLSFLLPPSPSHPTHLKWSCSATLRSKASPRSSNPKPTKACWPKNQCRVVKHSQEYLASFPGCLPLCLLDRIRDLWTGWFKGRVCLQENGVGDGLGTRLNGTSTFGFATWTRSVRYLQPGTLKLQM